ncbi:dnaJ homolog subfamily C member 17 isoform X2 [Ceratina calcarata]|uniref:DnaJ homolog subfamily C member 17 n=1 Tax=Ceratina calcarata TaxID=156304 RepID=A0AAJ7N8N4_9HYME|nr:dnaJ homolog subfamily C member 17 isoform X2 [Ceratina calcarata]
MEKMESLMEIDLYELIGVEQSASTQEIKKAYRKKALSCHPDKNPNNPRANELFHELSHALEILTDTSARAAYDKVLNARLQAKLRIKEFDAKRRKLKEDLEAREDAYRRSTTADFKSDKEKLQAEIDRLQKEGSKQLKEEIELMQKHFQDQLNTSLKESEVDNGSFKIRVKWKTDKNQSNDIYNYDTLHRIFSKYGDINALIVSPTGKGSALVEYQNKSDAVSINRLITRNNIFLIIICYIQELAVSVEVGFAQNPLKLQKLWSTVKESATFKMGASYSDNNIPRKEVNQRMSDSEFELSVLRNLRKAEELKRSGQLHTTENT